MEAKPRFFRLWFFAQQVYDVLPQVVSVGNDNLNEIGNLVSPWGLDYGKLTPVLVKAIQEQQVMIEAMKAEIEMLKNK